MKTIFLCLALLGTARAETPLPLDFPKSLQQPLLAGKPQTVTFFGTNQTSSPVKLAGYTSSCGCTAVEARGDTVPAKGTLEFRITISKNVPSAEYALIQDQYTNMYQVMIKITPPNTNQTQVKK